ncbi:MAG: hypothetical protein JWR55_2304 [Aeromicrobium sp.]|jgi:hypothetical protein|nr:hypothetical protein [Aeromicrobium sp.]
MTDAEQTITTDHLQALLDAEGGRTTIGLVGGRIAVIGAEQLGTEEFRGALEVIDRDELIDRLGDDRSAARLDDEAAALTAAVHLLGG